MKYYFGYYKGLHGLLRPVKWNTDTVPTPGTIWKVEIPKTEFGLRLEDLEHVYPPPDGNKVV